MAPERLIIFTAPSGSGKTTIVRHLLAQFDKLAFSISATTRKKRAHEINGRDYYFLTEDDFKQRIAAGDFIEWEEVYHNQYYGTLAAEVERLWAAGFHVVFDIDVRGARAIKEKYGERAYVIFVKVPSIYQIIERLKQRATESEQSLHKRIGRMKDEWACAEEFDYVLLNDDLAVTLSEAEEVVRFLLNN